jgi:hypothetical protein
MDNRLRSAARLLGVMLLCGATAFIAGAAVPNHSVRLGSAAAETSPRGETSLDIALAGTRDRVHRSLRRAGVERDRRQRLDRLVLDRVDGQSHRRPRARPRARRLRRDARRYVDHGAGQHQLRHHRRVNDSGSGRAAAVRPGGRAGVLAVGPRLAQGEVRTDRRDRQRRDATVHRRVSAVCARADECDPGPRRRSVSDPVLVHRSGAAVCGSVPESGGVCARYDPSAVPCEVPDGATTAMNW